MARRAVRATLSAPPLREIGARRAARAWRCRRLLVVCHGNMYRSPFAERFAAPRLRPGQEIASAGVAPAVGSPSPEDAVLAARRLGVDLHGQRSVALTREMLQLADAVFVFDERTLAGVLATDQRVLARVHLLGALNPDGPAMIDDPYNTPSEAIERVFRQIATAVEQGLRCAR